MSSDIRDYTESMLKSQTLYFGKYKGVPLENIPKSYIDWLRTTEMWGKLGKTLKKAIGRVCPSDKTRKTALKTYNKTKENEKNT